MSAATNQPGSSGSEPSGWEDLQPRRRKTGRSAAIALLVVLGFLGWYGFCYPVNVHPRESSRRTACSNNLHQIGMACSSYAEDNDDCLPDRLDRLYPLYLDNAKTFACPSAPSSWQDFEKRCATAKSSSYILLPGMRDDMPSDFIMAYEKPENHRRAGFHVLHIGARPEWWAGDRAAEFERRLAEQREKVRSWKPAANLGGAPATAEPEKVGSEAAAPEGSR
jgi:hypothetical protein